MVAAAFVLRFLRHMRFHQRPHNIFSRALLLVTDCIFDVQIAIALEDFYIEL